MTTAGLNADTLETGFVAAVHPKQGGPVNKLLAVAAAAEGLTGLALLIWPPIIRLAFGSEVSGVGVVACRIAAIALIALGLACWPARANDRAVSGIMTYSLLAAVYLIYLGLEGKWVGILLWPAVVIHLGVSALLVAIWFKSRRTEVK